MTFIFFHGQFQVNSTEYNVAAGMGVNGERWNYIESRVVVDVRCLCLEFIALI